MPAASTDPALAKLAALRTELADFAFDLERQRRLDAADVVIMIATRVAEVSAELAAGTSPTGPGDPV